MPTPTETVFGRFSTAAFPGAGLQIEAKLVEDAVSGAIGVRNTYQGTMRVFNLKQLYQYKYDFHLSFKLDPSATWATADGIHLCARDDDAGKNFCLYWFYRLVERAPGQLAWSFAGSAPDTPQNLEMREAVGIGPGAANSPTALRMLQRNATQPLDKILEKINGLIAQRRAQVADVLTDKVRRTMARSVLYMR